MKRKALFATVILSFCAGLLAAETGALFAVAEEYNQEYRRLQLNHELAALRAERQSIQARDRVDELQVAETIFSARETYRRGLESFYHAVLDVAFEVLTSSLRLDLAEHQVTRGTEQVSQAELRFTRGLVPQTEVINSRIELRGARRDRDNAQWSLQDAHIVFTDALGADWSQDLLPRVDAASFHGIDDPTGDWSERDAVLASVLETSPATGRAGVAAEKARVRHGRLPANAPAFDRRIADAEVEQAEFEVSRVRADTERQFEQVLRQLQSQSETILIYREELELREELARESRLNFERGMATSLERDQAMIQLLQTRIQLLNAELEFFKTRVTRQLLLGKTPAGEPIW